MAGTAAEGPASAPSRAQGRAGPAVWPAGAQEAGWQGARGLGCWAAGPLWPRAAVSAAPPSAAVAGTAAWVAGVQWGGRPGAACRAAAVEVCAGWRHSAPEAPWTGHTAAGLASVRPVGRPEGREASLLQDRKDPPALTLELESMTRRQMSPPRAGHRPVTQNDHAVGRLNWREI